MDDALALLVPQKETPPPVAADEGVQKVNCQAEIVDTPPEQVKQVGTWVSQYLAAGFALVPIAAGSKGPNVKGWNRLDGCVTRQEDAARITQGVGLAHAYSRTACLDVDDIDKAREWLAGQGVDLDALRHAADAVGISSGRPGRAKLLYRLPAGVEPLATKNLGEAAGLELRCATADGLTVQDVLPPSIHPETGKPYAWWFGDDLVGSVGALPDLPAELLAIWRELDKPAAQPEQRAAVGVGLDTLRECLAAIPPDELPYESSNGASWLGVGMALHHETDGQGFELWDEWARSSPKYSTREYGQAKWESFGKRTGGAALTLRALARWAGVDLNRPDVSEFEDLSGEGPRANRFQIQTMAEFRSARAAGLQWFVKGVLPRAGLVVLFGASTAGKTFAALDLMLAI
ncbi:bifunctional DNA primase/polymerase, partial [Aquabacterium sp. UBA2148]|uniref:bifunctional DNA primase/polymerase n=1 Tax=Aquabacterium sp. UBA2148 TaxID=1946042 RepID=UPI002580474B